MAMNEPGKNDTSEVAHGSQHEELGRKAPYEPPVVRVLGQMEVLTGSVAWLAGDSGYRRDF